MEETEKELMKFREQMGIGPVSLLKKVLKETENGGRVRTMTRNDIKRLLGKIDSPSHSCPECGTPAPSWAAECIKCGCVWD